MFPVEEELPAVLPLFDALEVLAAITLIRAELPPEVLAQISAEVNRSVEVENQVARLWCEDTGAQLAERRHLPMVDQAVHQAIRKAR
jgi:hypothetical protein